MFAMSIREPQRKKRERRSSICGSNDCISLRYMADTKSQTEKVLKTGGRVKRKRDRGEERAEEET